MDLDDIKAHLDRLFAARPRPASREETAGLRDALLQFKMGIGEIRTALVRTERELQLARKEVTDYARRGGLAAEIGDAETVKLAEEYTTKVSQRVDLLERKVIVQRDELAMAEREYEATMVRFKAASRGIPYEPISAHEHLADATGDPGDATPAVDDALLNQRAKEAVVDAQLEMLKKKLGDKK